MTNVLMAKTTSLLTQSFHILKYKAVVPLKIVSATTEYFQSGLGAKQDTRVYQGTNMGLDGEGAVGSIAVTTVINKRR